MSEEEKKAIEWLKKADWFSARLYSTTILNLIEKQSKEIEELKRKEQLIKTYKGNLPENVEIICLCKNDFERNISNDYISKDKIKAKIEELQDDIKYSANPLSIDNSKFGIKVLQSLLEKE